MGPHRSTTRVTGARVLLAAVGMLLASSCVASPPTGTPAPGPGDWRTEMLASVNAVRSQSGAGPLAFCGTLGAAAQAHSEDQAAHGTMSHTGSDGSSPWVRIDRAGYRGWNAAAENVASGYPDVTSVMDGWMGSSGHRANILGPQYTHVGFGLAHSTDGRTFWTQDFGAGGTC